MVVLRRILISGLVLLACSVSAQEATRDLQRVRAEPAQVDVYSAERVALVIGNSDYDESPLKNPANDAEDMGKVLEGLGFEVITGVDQTEKEMKASVRDFRRRLEASGGVGFFYYAGHGMQSRETNYLIPIGADIEVEEDIDDEAISANWVQEMMDGAGNKLNVVVLDACRNNPLGRSFSRSGGQGLAQTDFQGEIGTLIALSTSPGRVAKDGRGRNSPFAKHLIAALQVPGLEIAQLFTLVKGNVRKETNNVQRPWTRSSLHTSFYFTPPADGIPAPVNYTIPQQVDEGTPTSLIASITVAALLACALAYLVYHRRHPEVVTVDTFAALTRDNLGAIYSAAATAYLCGSKNGQPMAPIVTNKPFLIGRSSKAGLTLHDERVSGRHAELNFDGQVFTISDLGSTNGTFVDAQRLAPESPRQLSPNGSFYLSEPDLGFSIRYLES